MMENLTIYLNHELGIKWDAAQYALDAANPKETAEFFQHYKGKSYEECRAFCATVAVALLASFLAYESRYLTHWSGGYQLDEVAPFFIAGLERLLSE